MEAKRKARIILDTNFFLIPFQFHVDIFSELDRVVDVPFDLCTTKQVLDELEALLQSPEQKERLAARLGLEFVKKMIDKSWLPAFGAAKKQKSLKILRISPFKHTDDSILEIASSGDIVATQDKELKKRLKEKNIKIATLKQKKYLVVE